MTIRGKSDSPPRDVCPVCHSPLEFFPGVVRYDENGAAAALGFVLRCPNPEPISTDASGWYTSPFTIREKSVA